MLKIYLPPPSVFLRFPTCCMNVSNPNKPVDKCVHGVAHLFLKASIGIANLLVMAMEEEGTDYHDAKDRIFLADSRGLVTKVTI